MKSKELLYAERRVYSSSNVIHEAVQLYSNDSGIVAYCELRVPRSYCQLRIFETESEYHSSDQPSSPIPGW
jgi:hypothetical protein